MLHVGLYFYTLIIGHKSCNKELQTVAINNVFLNKKVKTQQQQTNNQT